MKDDTKINMIIGMLVIIIFVVTTTLFITLHTIIGG